MIKKILTNRIFLKCAKRTIAFLFFMSTTPAVSAIPYRNAFEYMDLINEQTKELNLSLLAKIQIIVNENYINMANYIPITNIPQFDDGSYMARRILKQTLSTWLNDDASAKSNTTLSSSIQRGGGTIQLKLKTVETTAEVSYKGYVTAVLSYDVSESEAQLEVSKQLGTQTYAFTHTDNNEGVADKFGVRWNF
jgi:hypothetical protein